MIVLSEVCCICVEKDPELKNINEPDENNVKYSKKLALCAPNQNWLEDFYICKNCMDKLDVAYYFVQSCIQSEQLRNKKLKQSETQPLKHSNEVFGCDACGKYFKLKRTLKLHITRIHTNPRKKEKPSPKKEREDALKTEDKPFENIKPTEDIKKSESSDEEDQFEAQEIAGNYSSDDDDVKVKLSPKKNWSKRKHPLKCEYCGKFFNRRQHWSAHIRAKHTFEKPYECDLCDAKYTNSHGLLVHKRNHNNEKPFICSSCGKSFVCSGDLYHHSKIHSNKREYKCDMCDKSFNTTSILRTHKICMHTEPQLWKYICNLCDRRFPINSSLVTHMKRHTGIKEFSCHICDKKFFDKSELTKHIRSHTNERQYKCDFCHGKEYKNRYGLRKHMKIVHDVGNIKISKPVKKYLCPMCPKIFAFNNKLQKHIFTHTGEKPYNCDYCEKKFIDNYYRKVHLKKKHNIDTVESLQ